MPNKNELPVGWEHARLDQVVEVRDGLRDPVNSKERATRAGPYPYYGANGQAGTIDDFRFEGEHVLLAEDGGHFSDQSRGVAYRVGGKFWVNNHAHVLRAQGGIPNALIEHWLNTINWMPYVSGSTRPKLTQGAMNAVVLPIPPLAEQQRIVAKLEALLARSHKAREALDTIPSLLERFRQSVLAAAFRGDLTADWRERNPDVEPATKLLDRIRAERRRRWEEAELERMRTREKAPKDDRWKTKYEQPMEVYESELAELPAGWCWAAVDQIASRCEYGTSARTVEGTDGIPVLRMGNIADGRLMLGNLKYLPRAHHEFPTLILSPGDVLFNRTNSPELVGKSAVYEGSPSLCSFASYLIRIRVCLYEPALLSYFINSRYGRTWVASAISQQVGQANVSGGKLRRLAVPVPPLAEQRELVRRVDGALSAVREITARVSSAAARVVDLESSVLSQAFRGELVPQDPEDEPASVLLDRLRTHRNGAEKHEKKRELRRSKSAA